MTKVLLITTGGTISGGKNPETGEDMPLQGESLLKLIPETKKKYNAEYLDFCLLPSPQITLEMALSLAKTINKRFHDDPALSGVVITHGTDTLEETAFLLWLTVNDERPVVLTAAQRPPKEDASDAVRNLRNAIQVAANNRSKGKGVMVCLNNELNSARYVRKTHTWALQSFSSGSYGLIGYVDKDDVIFYEKPLNRLTLDAETVDEDIDLVKITQSNNTRYLDASIREKASGIVIEASGRGFAPLECLEKLYEAREAGISVVMVSRCFEGRIDLKDKHQEAGIIAGEDLDGLKARVLLSLLLPKTNPETIQGYFDHLSGRKTLELV